MNQASDGQDDMRPEYDIRGGERGKYYRRYMASLFLVETTTASLGTHPEESTIRFVAEPIYQAAVPVTQ